MEMIEFTVNILCVPSAVFFNYIALDEMGTKIDELEQSINDLKAEMGTEMPAKKPDEAKPADSA
jgi:heat shock factor-binding protein 1